MGLEVDYNVQKRYVNGQRDPAQRCAILSVDKEKCTCDVNSNEWGVMTAVHFKELDLSFSTTQELQSVDYPFLFRHSRIVMGLSALQ